MRLRKEHGAGRTRGGEAAGRPPPTRPCGQAATCSGRQRFTAPTLPQRTTQQRSCARCNRHPRPRPSRPAHVPSANVAAQLLPPAWPRRRSVLAAVLADHYRSRPAPRWRRHRGAALAGPAAKGMEWSSSTLASCSRAKTSNVQKRREGKLPAINVEGCPAEASGALPSALFAPRERRGLPYVRSQELI
jgi:hypothetical protein